MAAPSAGQERVTNAELRETLAVLASRMERIENDIAYVKQCVENSNERVRQIEQSEAGYHPLTTNRVERLESRVDAHGKQIDELAKSVHTIAQSVKTLSWALGIVGAGVLTWLVAQIMALIGG